ncbi:MAG: RES family NAD+ phosphorylase [Hyphomonadaceae bacterium]|nr:RES family NAD+ phosphorylase [Hyphomonadaceae bacterium]
MTQRSGPRSERPIRDQGLLDSLERITQKPYEGVVWRSVKQGRDPLTCWRSGGRWDDKSFDVLYTSETREAAIQERRFHLYQGQPIPPSKAQYELFELHVSLQSVMAFPTLDTLKGIGMDVSGYGQASYFEKEREYPRSQEIAEACSFLGADGVLVPSARDQTANNLVIFCEQDTKIELEMVRSHGVIDWNVA